MQLKILTSRRLAASLALLLIVLVIINGTMIAKERAGWDEAKKDGAAKSQAIALAHALTEYCKDFPETEHVANNGEWTRLLAGQNAKNIVYLKLEKFGRDASDRLTDPCGLPYAIEELGTPGFKPFASGREATEFHVRSDGCREGLGVGQKAERSQ